MEMALDSEKDSSHFLSLPLLHLASWVLPVQGICFWPRRCGGSPFSLLVVLHLGHGRMPLRLQVAHAPIHA
jgi:hypothetical protein